MKRPSLVSNTGIRKLTWLLFGVSVLLGGCWDRPGSPANLFPAPDAFPNWATASPVEVFDRENIYDLVDGQAESFFAYGFEQVAVQRYENAAGAILRIAIWQLTTPADAYGLFTTTRSGTSVPVGNEGDADPGRRTVFWQDRYFVDLFAQPELPDTELQGLARSVSAQLPAGGARPTLEDLLPPEGLVARSAIFFHEELSIQDQLWLGGENILALGPETDGILARYERDGKVALLLLVQYPAAQAAAAAVANLKGMPASGPLIANSHGDLLGAVFGAMDSTAAGRLLSEALAGR